MRQAEVQTKRHTQRPGREALSSSERQLVLDEFFAGGSRTDVVNRALEQLRQAGKEVSRRSVQRWVAELDYIVGHRLREPLTDEQWNEAKQTIGVRHGVTRRSLDGWIAAVSAWEQRKAASEVLRIVSTATAPMPGSGPPKPRLAELFAAMAARHLGHDVLEFVLYPREEWMQRVNAFVRHLEAAPATFEGEVTGNGNADREDGTPQALAKQRDDPATQVHRLAVRLVGALGLYFLRENLEGEIAPIWDLIHAVEPEQRGKPQWWGAGYLRYGLPRWAAFIAACRLIELAVRETLPPNPLWVELAKQTTEVEGERGILHMQAWLGPWFTDPGITMDHRLQLRQWVWRHADKIWRGEAKLYQIDSVQALVHELAEAWKLWWAQGG